MKTQLIALVALAVVLCSCSNFNSASEGERDQAAYDEGFKRGQVDREYKHTRDATRSMLESRNAWATSFASGYAAGYDQGQSIP